MPEVIQVFLVLFLVSFVSCRTIVFSLHSHKPTAKVTRFSPSVFFGGRGMSIKDVQSHIVFTDLKIYDGDFNGNITEKCNLRSQTFKFSYVINFCKLAELYTH